MDLPLEECRLPCLDMDDHEGETLFAQSSRSRPRTWGGILRLQNPPMICPVLASSISANAKLSPPLFSITLPVSGGQTRIPSATFSTNLHRLHGQYQYSLFPYHAPAANISAGASDAKLAGAARVRAMGRDKRLCRLQALLALSALFKGEIESPGRCGQGFVKCPKWASHKSRRGQKMSVDPP